MIQPAPRVPPQLALVGAVAKLLSAGLRPERTLEAIAETLQERLPARAVAFWLRDPTTRGFRAVASAPTPAVATVAGSLDELPALGPGGVRVPLLYEGERFGLLEAELAGVEMGAEVLAVVADVLGPFLTSLEISEDLAFEVALQSREIQEQRRFTSLVIDSLPVGLYVVDREYRIQFWNRKRETGTQGLPRSDVVGQLVFDVLTRQPAPELQAEFDRVFETGEIQQADVEVAGEEPKVFRLTRIPMRLGEAEVTHVITIGEDVTEWRMIQERITQAEKLAAIGQLAAGVMHEINNPLATIGACVAALEGRVGQGSAGGDAAQEYLDIIGKEVERCSGIVDGLLDFSRPKSKAKEALDLNTLLDHTLFLLKHHQRFKHLEVVREFDSMLPPALGNQEQLVQVFMALMLNALDAMEHGGRLTVRSGRDAQTNSVVAAIEDTGIGIPRDAQTKIFEPFYTTKPPGRGTGLGLSICYGIVQDHRGRLEVDSHPERGTTMRVYLPVVGRGSQVVGRES